MKHDLHIQWNISQLKGNPVIMLWLGGARTQSQKDKFRLNLLIRDTKESKFIQTENGKLVAWAGEVQSRGYYFSFVRQESSRNLLYSNANTLNIKLKKGQDGKFDANRLLSIFKHTNYFKNANKREALWCRMKAPLQETWTEFLASSVGLYHP